MMFQRKKRKASILDMSPLIDCVLQLLIFFMLSSTFASPKVRIDLPETAISSGTTQNDSIVVTAGTDGGLFVNQSPVSLEAMESLLRVELGKSESGRVVFRGDKDVSYGVFSKVMEAARRAGARKFDLAQSPGEKNEGPNGK